MSARRFKPYPEYKDSGVEWLGEIPAHWEVKRLRFVSESNPMPREVRGLPGETEVSFIPMEAVGEGGGLSLETTQRFADVKAGYTYFRDGDIVIAKITPCFENGKGALAAGLANGIAFGTTELHVLRTTDAADRRFMFYVSLSDAFRRMGEADMYGAGGQKRISESFVRNFLPALPSLPEQRAIASFLDRETARIDALAAEKERLIELLQEQRTALITRAVTKGLDPNVPMKDSGVEWLGEIPVHWEVTHLKHVALRISACPHETPTYDDDGGHLVIRTSDVSEGRLDLAHARRVDDHEFARRVRRLRVEPDDIVYGREGERFGFAASVPEGTSVCLGQRMMQFRIGPEWCARFTMWQLNAKSVYQQAALDTAGATSPHVNVETIRNYWICGPAIPEQRAIAAFLDRETARIDALVAKVREAIERLKELRTALISAAVTGKLDVREVAS